MTPVRSVLDTNIIVSGLLWGGPPSKLIDVYIPRGLLKVCTSPPLISETYRVLEDSKFSLRVLQVGLNVRSSLTTIYADAEIYADIPPVSAIKEDPSDNAVLATALAAKADNIISGDKHLRRLKFYEGIDILTASEALRKLQKGPSAV